jgi:transketolase
MLQDIQILNEKETRAGFGDGIAEVARTNPNVVALTADLGWVLKIEPIYKRKSRSFCSMWYSRSQYDWRGGRP